MTLHGLQVRVLHIRAPRISHAFTFMFWHRDVRYLLEKRDLVRPSLMQKRDSIDSTPVHIQVNE